MDFHLFGLVRPQQIERETFRLFAIQPAVVISRVQDNRHPWVDRRHHFIRFRGHDGEGLEPVSVRVLPGVPEAREAQQIAVREFEAVGLLKRRRNFAPLIKSVGADDASPLFHRFTPGRSLHDRLRACVDRR